MESEIWWTVLFRQQSIFLTLASLKDHLSDGAGEGEGDGEEEGDGILSTALWCSGILLPLLLCASRRFLRGREDCPPDLCCPMSLELFRDPVVAADGETYERWWIEKWIREKQPKESRARHGTGVLSPMGHGMLSHTRLVSNQAVRRLANQWRETHVKST
ncbi:unnamed protein product [Effrenium voratum]|nr:unnamed protein product [Effrenium voratum]